MEALVDVAFVCFHRVSLEEQLATYQKDAVSHLAEIEIDFYKASIFDVVHLANFGVASNK